MNRDLVSKYPLKMIFTLMPTVSITSFLNRDFFFACICTYGCWHFDDCMLIKRLHAQLHSQGEGQGPRGVAGSQAVRNINVSPSVGAGLWQSSCHKCLSWPAALANFAPPVCASTSPLVLRACKPPKNFGEVANCTTAHKKM